MMLRVKCESVKEPQGESINSYFICSVSYEAFLEALFRVKVRDLDFTRAIEIAIETEDAAKVAWETAHGSRPKPVSKHKRPPGSHILKEEELKIFSQKNQPGQCCYKSSRALYKLGEPNEIHSKTIELETATTEVQDFNLLGRAATSQLGIFFDELLNPTEDCYVVFRHLKTDQQLRSKCSTLCEEFPDLWKPEWGCHMDFQLDVKFHDCTQPVLRKARLVPCAIEKLLMQVYQDGMKISRT
ncbi:hypothetical protein CAPTEDRAFT_221157 [Capitella teleta]|uniref:Uncharacterized protein n=1 Tax=Capitella teleta TaxID=283909 RepID=R7V2Q4_CAPTE|nr:hypothetical protein CAPTEDRAFT_221157 [Capitella teleta]|eukprot:ELU12747.1 hypothetical protein CAPTEDRAFT_221157 [Capitella teleta]